MSKWKEYRLQIAVVFLAFAFGYLMYKFWSGASTKSDLDSLFAGWAFVGLIATVALQSMELHFQRTELTETRQVHTRTAAAQENSEAALNRQISATNQATLINGYTALLDYYDKPGGRQTSTPEVDQAKHVRARIKQVIDNVEAEQGWSGTFGPRPADWDRI